MNTNRIPDSALDAHLDAILRACGSALWHCGATGKMIDGMRDALRTAVVTLASASAKPAPAPAAENGEVVVTSATQNIIAVAWALINADANNDLEDFHLNDLAEAAEALTAEIELAPRAQLTGVEIDALLAAHGRVDDGLHAFARAIEARGTVLARRERLTDEHIDNIGYACGITPGKRNDFGRAIEAAHGIGTPAIKDSLTVEPDPAHASFDRREPGAPGELAGAGRKGGAS